MLLGSTKNTLSMESLRSTMYLQSFILDKIKKMKTSKENELHVRLSFAVATVDDEIVDIADLEAEDEENCFLQLEMNKPRLKQSRQEMSRGSKLSWDMIRIFCQKSMNRMDQCIMDSRKSTAQCCL